LMSVVKRIIKDAIERMKVDELLGEEFEESGYGGITLTKTPLGAQINLSTMRPGRVIGKRGRAIKAASERLERELNILNPQITVIEVEIPEINPRIMASRIANALERGVHYRRAIFWALRRIMDSGALGCEIVIRGKLRSDRSRFEKVSDGYIPKAGDAVVKQLRAATMHVKLKRGVLGITVTIVPPEAKFPDKISLKGLPDVEVPEEEYPLPEGVEPEVTEPSAVNSQPAEAEEPPIETEKSEEKTVNPESTEEAKPTEKPGEEEKIKAGGEQPKPTPENEVKPMDEPKETESDSEAVEDAAEEKRVEPATEPDEDEGREEG